MSHYPRFVLHNMQNCHTESAPGRLGIVHQIADLALINNNPQANFSCASNARAKNLQWGKFWKNVRSETTYAGCHKAVKYLLLVVNAN
jgi:hypothetical protein